MQDSKRYQNIFSCLQFSVTAVFLLLINGCCKTKCTTVHRYHNYPDTISKGPNEWCPTNSIVDEDKCSCYNKEDIIMSHFDKNETTCMRRDDVDCSHIFEDSLSNREIDDRKKFFTWSFPGRGNCKEYDVLGELYVWDFEYDDKAEWVNDWNRIIRKNISVVRELRNGLHKHTIKIQYSDVALWRGLLFTVNVTCLDTYVNECCLFKFKGRRLYPLGNDRSNPDPFTPFPTEATASPHDTNKPTNAHTNVPVTNKPTTAHTNIPTATHANTTQADPNKHTTTNVNNSSKDKGGSNTTVIILAVVITALVIILIVVVLIFCCLRRKRKPNSQGNGRNMKTPGSRPPLQPPTDDQHYRSLEPVPVNTYEDLHMYEQIPAANGFSANQDQAGYIEPNVTAIPRNYRNRSTASTSSIDQEQNVPQDPDHPYIVLPDGTLTRTTQPPSAIPNHRSNDLRPTAEHNAASAKTDEQYDNPSFQKEEESEGHQYFVLEPEQNNDTRS